MRLRNKVAIVTGGGTGIGEAIATVFAREGATVAITGRRKAELEQVAKNIRQQGGQALVIQGSVTAEPDVRNAVDATVRTFGRLDVLVNNAGNLFHAGPLHNTSDDIWDETFDIFMKGTFRFIRAAIPQMLKQGGGVIVNVSSVAGLVGFQGLPAYCASKGGVIQLTRAAALEYATKGIRINAVCPGVIRTPMVERVTGGKPEAMAQFTALDPVGRMGTPEEIAGAVVWLCSDAASFVTGHPMVVDGGLVAQ